MQKIFLALFSVLLIQQGLHAQELFSYGKYKVAPIDFMHAFKNNNPEQLTGAAKATAMRKYLDLYINYCLKVQEAKDMGLDTLPQYRQELSFMINKYLGEYTLDTAEVTRLVTEAYQRSQKDVHAAFIFVSADFNGATDSTRAKARLAHIMSRLKKGDDFLKVAREESDEKENKSSPGDLGFLTAFILPYEMENAVYQLKPGQYSEPVKMRNGYFIFNNIAERKALGEYKFKQILLAFPPNATDAEKQKVRSLADSLYPIIKGTKKIDSLAGVYSHDAQKNLTSEYCQWVPVGEIDSRFESKVRSLATEGSIAPPFEMEDGMHIVKLLGFNTTTSSEFKNNIIHKVRSDNRHARTQDFMLKAVKDKKKVKIFPIDYRSLTAFSDSIILHSYMVGGNVGIKANTPILQIDSTVYDASQWAIYAGAFRKMRDGHTLRPYPSIMDDYIATTIKQYYVDYLEELNDDYRLKVNNIVNGNLVYEISKIKLYNKLQEYNDTELYKVYEANKQKYRWNKSVDAIVFSGGQKDHLERIKSELSKPNANWKTVIAIYNSFVVTDSVRINWNEVPGLDNATPAVGMLTNITTPNNSSQYSFALIQKVYTKPQQKSYGEAVPQVMEDYQAATETKWIQEMRKKYPIKINETALQKIIK